MAMAFLSSSSIRSGLMLSVAIRKHLMNAASNVSRLATSVESKTEAAPARRENSENSKANRIETMKGPAESGQICSVGRRKIAKNKRCYANTPLPPAQSLGGRGELEVRGHNGRRPLPNPFQDYLHI